MFIRCLVILLAICGPAAAGRHRPYPGLVQVGALTVARTTQVRSHRQLLTSVPIDSCESLNYLAVGHLRHLDHIHHQSTFTARQQVRSENVVAICNHERVPWKGLAPRL